MAKQNVERKSQDRRQRRGNEVGLVHDRDNQPRPSYLEHDRAVVVVVVSLSAHFPKGDETPSPTEKKTYDKKLQTRRPQKMLGCVVHSWV